MLNDGEEGNGFGQGVGEPWLDETLIQRTLFSFLKPQFNKRKTQLTKLLSETLILWNIVRWNLVLFRTTLIRWSLDSMEHPQPGHQLFVCILCIFLPYFISSPLIYKSYWAHFVFSNASLSVIRVDNKGERRLIRFGTGTLTVHVFSRLSQTFLNVVQINTVWAYFICLYRLL